MDFNNGVFQYENKLKIFKIMSVVNITSMFWSTMYINTQQKVEWKEKVWKKKMHNQLSEPQNYEDCQAKLIQEFVRTSQGMD